jgi:hypothetical protein
MKLFMGWLALTVLAMPCCRAQSAHEMSVGAQTEQICDPSLIETISTYLDLPTLVLKSEMGEPSDSVLVAAACKVNPANRGQTIVAVAYDAREEYEKNLILALVDSSRHRVTADYQGRIDEDAATRVDSGSLWIDTAAYVLAPGVRALGLDVTSGYMPNCGDGGTGAKRSLYVQAGKHIRPVLEGLYMSSWQFIQRGQDRCNAQAAPDTPSIIDRTGLTLSIGDGSSNGYRDLRVDVVSQRDGGDGGKPRSEPPAHYTLHYDGKRYPVPTGLGLL